jgi:hypothetical protein
MDSSASDSDDSDRGGSSKPGVPEVTDEIDSSSSESDSDDSMQSDSYQIEPYKSRPPCFAGKKFDPVLHEMLCSRKKGGLQRDRPTQTTSYKNEICSVKKPETHRKKEEVRLDPKNSYGMLKPDEQASSLKTTGPGARPPRIPGGSTLKGILG